MALYSQLRGDPKRNPKNDGSEQDPGPRHFVWVFIFCFGRPGNLPVGGSGAASPDQCTSFKLQPPQHHPGPDPTTTTTTTTKTTKTTTNGQNQAQVQNTRPAAQQDAAHSVAVLPLPWLSPEYAKPLALTGNAAARQGGGSVERAPVTGWPGGGGKDDIIAVNTVLEHAAFWNCSLTTVAWPGRRRGGGRRRRGRRDRRIAEVEPPAIVEGKDLQDGNRA